MKQYLTVFAIMTILAGVFCSCMLSGGGPIDCEVYGETELGEPVCQYTLKKGDIKALITNFGGTLLSLEVPGRDGRTINIVRGHRTLSEYAQSTASPNAIVGRGPRGEELDKVIWDVEPLEEGDAVGVRLRFPGEHGEVGVRERSDLNNIVVTYWLSEDNEFEIECEYFAGKVAPEGVTHNIHFSLSDVEGAGALDHQLAIAADNFYPVDKDLAPLGVHRSVRETPFDFLKPERIDARISSGDAQLRVGNGYNHCWALNKADIREVSASLFDPQSGRYMDVLTGNPCLHFSSAKPDNEANHVNRGFCVKAQSLPGKAVNPGELVRIRTIYRFSTL